MKRALVIGKFMPVHAGHVALIRFAATHGDEVIVSMSYTQHDPISHELRFSWLQEIFQEEKNIHVALVHDDFDDESLPWPVRTKLWAGFLSKKYPKVDCVVSSESYGELLAAHLGVEHVSFDPARKQVPVSATLIRQRPFEYWQYIPQPVRPYFVKKICFYGPESTGKSVMSRYLAEYYHTEAVPEVARELLTNNDFSVEDIIRIGQAQTQRVLEKTKTANKILFCDTDVITTQVYCRHYLHQVPDILYDLEKQVQYDQYFLFDIDVPWVADEMRDLGERRLEMFRVFEHELDKRKIPYVLVSGSWQERQELIKSVIDRQIGV